MNKYLQTIIQKLQRITLSEKERGVLRARLEEYTEYNPVRSDTSPHSVSNRSSLDAVSKTSHRHRSDDMDTSPHSVSNRSSLDAVSKTSHRHRSDDMDTSPHSVSNRSSLDAVREADAIRQYKQEPSPIWAFLYQPVTKTHMNVAIGLIVALVLGGGTSVSAEQAVPGDLLYPVKTEINENVRGALTFGAEGEANWNARVAERRLEEAEQLAAENRLDAEMAARLKNAFEVHAERADRFATKLEERGDNAKSAEVRSDMQAHFEAHANVISSIATNIGTSSESGTRTNVDELLSTVRAHAQSASNARARAEASVEADTGPRASQAAESKIANAERAIARAQSALDDMETDARAGLKAQAQTQLDLAGEHVVEAKASVEAEAYTEASRLAQQAQRTATRVLVFVRNTNVIDISGDAGIGIGVVGRGAGDTSTEEDTRDNDTEDDNQDDDETRNDDRDEENTDRQRLLAAVRAHLAQENNVSAENIEVVSVESQQWSDGCLGLGGPAESCLQAITPGYEVTVRVDGELHVYRTDADGSQVREDTEASVDVRGEVDVDLR